MSLTASRLSKAGTRSREVDTVIRERLQHIDIELGKHVPVWGVNTVKVELPQTFTLPGLEKKDAQRLVYSQILESLRVREFTAGLELGEARTFVHIGWLHEFSTEELDAMNRQIQSALIQGNDPVEAFRQRVAKTATPIRTSRPETRPAPLPAQVPLQAKTTLLPRGELPDWAS